MLILILFLSIVLHKLSLYIICNLIKTPSRFSLGSNAVSCLDKVLSESVVFIFHLPSFDAITQYKECIKKIGKIRYVRIFHHNVKNHDFYFLNHEVQNNYAISFDVEKSWKNVKLTGEPLLFELNLGDHFPVVITGLSLKPDVPKIVVSVLKNRLGNQQSVLLTSPLDYGNGKIRKYGTNYGCHMCSYERYLREGDIVFDIGANIGDTSVYFAKIVGTSGSVFTFEPDRRVYQQMVANVMLNGVSDIVHSFNFGLRDFKFNRNVELYYPDRTNLFFSMRTDVQSSPEDVKTWEYVKRAHDNLNMFKRNLTQTIRLEALSDVGHFEDILELALTKGGDRKRIRYLKLDVEGSECMILKGIQDFIDKHVPEFIEIEDHHGRSEIIVKELPQYRCKTDKSFVFCMSHI